jgi:hypothetical protein
MPNILLQVSLIIFKMILKSYFYGLKVRNTELILIKFDIGGPYFEFEFLYILPILSRLVPLDTEQVKGLHTLVCWYKQF